MPLYNHLKAWPEDVVQVLCTFTYPAICVIRCSLVKSRLFGREITEKTDWFFLWMFGVALTRPSDTYSGIAGWSFSRVPLYSPMDFRLVNSGTTWFVDVVPEPSSSLLRSIEKGRRHLSLKLCKSSARVLYPILLVSDLEGQCVDVALSFWQRTHTSQSVVDVCLCI